MSPGGIRNRNPIKTKTKSHALDRAASGIGPSLIYLNNLRMDGHVDGLGETRNIYKKFGRKRSWATNIWKTWSHIHPLIDIRFFKSASYTTLNQI